MAKIELSRDTFLIRFLFCFILKISRSEDHQNWTPVKRHLLEIFSVFARLCKVTILIYFSWSNCIEMATASMIIRILICCYKITWFITKFKPKTQHTTKIFKHDTLSMDSLQHAVVARDEKFKPNQCMQYILASNKSQFLIDKPNMQQQAEWSIWRSLSSSGSWSRRLARILLELSHRISICKHSNVQ